MKKVILLLIILTLLLCAACGEKPVTHANASLVTFTFKEAVEIANLIATVKILGIKEEDDRHTIFEARVTETLYGEEKPKDIIKFRMGGNSTFIVDYVPVYSLKKGEEYILFLKDEGVMEGFSPLYEDVYLLMGQYLCAFEIIEQDNISYVAGRSIWKDELTDILEEKNIRDKIMQYKLNKKVKHEKISNLEVYKKSDFIQVIKKQIEIKGKTK